MRVKDLLNVLPFMPPESRVVTFDRREEEWVEPEEVTPNVDTMQVELR